MPELPEVEVVRRGAQHWFVGRTIGEVSVSNSRAIRRHEPGEADFVGQLQGVTIVGTGRRGKYFWFNLDSGDVLVVHLGMSGQLRVQQADDVVNPHLRVRIRFSDERDELWFIDQRTFGGMFVDEVSRPESIPRRLSHIAPDPLSAEFDQAAVVRRMRAKESPVKAVLLDQTVVSGVGNIYADESLWRAKLHWQRTASSLSAARLRDLLNHSREVMTEALNAGGTSFDSLYVNVNGSSGYFSRHLAAYGRVGEPCNRCGALLVREQFANRSSYRCPRCQRRERNSAKPSVRSRDGAR